MRCAGFCRITRKPSKNLDVSAAAEVWPSVDRRALSRAFATLKSQGLNFVACDIVVVESNATASCHGSVEFVRRVGRPEPMTAQQRWVFKMRKIGTHWMIEEVIASPAEAVRDLSEAENSVSTRLLVFTLTVMLLIDPSAALAQTLLGQLGTLLTEQGPAETYVRDAAAALATTVTSREPAADRTSRCRPRLPRVASSTA